MLQAIQGLRRLAVGAGLSLLLQPGHLRDFGKNIFLHLLKLSLILHFGLVNGLTLSWGPEAHMTAKAVSPVMSRWQ